MAADPYGYADSAPPASPGADASRAMWAGVGAAMLGSIGICFCYVPYLLALPLAVYAVWKGYGAVGAVTDARERDMATVGLVSGAVSSVVAGGFTLFALMYVVFVGLYLLLIFGLVMAGALADSPPL